MRKPKLNITKKYLLDMKLAENKVMTSIRLNEKLHGYSKDFANFKGWNFADYFTRVILAHAMNEKNGVDIFAALEDI